MKSGSNVRHPTIPVSERTLQEQTRQILKLIGPDGTGQVTAFFHAWDSRRSQPGFPDWTIVFSPDLIEPTTTWYPAPPYVAWVELKSTKGKLFPEQQRWRNALGDSYHVCRSIDEFLAVLRLNGVTGIR